MERWSTVYRRKFSIFFESTSQINSIYIASGSVNGILSSLPLEKFLIYFRITGVLYLIRRFVRRAGACSATLVTRKKDQNSLSRIAGCSSLLLCLLFSAVVATWGSGMYDQFRFRKCWSCKGNDISFWRFGNTLLNNYRYKTAIGFRLLLVRKKNYTE